MYPGLSRHAYFTTFSFSEFLDFNNFLYLFLVYTVEPCYKSSFQESDKCFMGVFSSFGREVETGRDGKKQGRV